MKRRIERAAETLAKTGDVERFFRNGALTKPYADGDGH